MGGGRRKGGLGLARAWPSPGATKAGGEAPAAPRPRQQLWGRPATMLPSSVGNSENGDTEDGWAPLIANLAGWC